MQTEPPKLQDVLDSLGNEGRMQAFVPLRRHFPEVLKNPQDELADKLADAVQLKLIINPPKDEGHKFSATILMDLPIEAETQCLASEENPIAMVSTMSGITRAL